jgi:hypothetical protein
MINVYLPEIHIGHCRSFVEVFPFVPFANNEVYSEIVKQASSHNAGLYSKLRFLPQSLHGFLISNEYSNCDYVLIPGSYAGQSFSKKSIGFYVNDYEGAINIPENVTLFRTSVNKSIMKINERVMPVIVPDHCLLDLDDKIENLSVGFCGFVHNVRGAILSNFRYKHTDFILYDRFFTSHNDLTVARKVFYDNLSRNSFSLCMRGHGNFSYRFYEALSFGRIPIFIDTGAPLPFERAIEWDEHIIRVDLNDSMNMSELDWNSLLSSSAGKLSPRKNRELWLKYFSEVGYFRNFLTEL